MLALLTFLTPSLSMAEIVIPEELPKEAPKNKFNIAPGMTIKSFLPITCGDYKITMNNFFEAGVQLDWIGYSNNKTVVPLLAQGYVASMYYHPESNMWYWTIRPQVNPKIICFISTGDKSFFIDKPEKKEKEAKKIPS